MLLTKPFRQTLISLLFLLHTGFLVHAQTAIPVSGGMAAGAGGSLSTTFGQVFYTASSGETGTVTQGMQQPYEISVLRFDESGQRITLQYRAFPNPTTNFLFLEIENYGGETLQYFLCDLEGKILDNNIISGPETRISMEKRIAGIYFIRVLGNEYESISFKIIKIE
jgi:hypothetical protein